MKVKIKSFNGILEDLTVGNIYEVTHNFGDGEIGIEDDEKFWFITRLNEPCTFLNGGEWEVCSEG